MLQPQVGHNNVAVIQFLLYNHLKYSGLPPPANAAYLVIFQCVMHTFLFLLGKGRKYFFNFSHKKKHHKCSVLKKVELTGVEPVSKRGSNMLSTCLASSSVFVCRQERSHQSTPYPLNVHSDYAANRNYSRFYLHLLVEPLRDLAFGRCLVPASNAGIKLIYYTSIKQRERNYFRQLYFAVYD